jgi:hypothetical protein
MILQESDFLRARRVKKVPEGAELIACGKLAGNFIGTSHGTY